MYFQHQGAKNINALTLPLHFCNNSCEKGSFPLNCQSRKAELLFPLAAEEAQKATFILVHALIISIARQGTPLGPMEKNYWQHNSVERNLFHASMNYCRNADVV